MDDPDGWRMSSQARAALELLAIADELELWLADIPGWLPESPEPLEALQRQRAEAEDALVNRLRNRLAGDVILKENGALVELVLGGLRVRSADRLKGACEAWIVEARRRAGDKLERVHSRTG